MKSARNSSRRFLAASFLCLAASGTANAGTHKKDVQDPPAAPATAAPVDDVASFSSVSPTKGITHIIVGHSIFLNTKHRLTRVYVTNPAVLDSYTASPNQVICTTKEPGVSSLVLWDEAGEVATYVISSDIDVETLRGSIKQALPNEAIDTQGTEGRVVLTGSVSSNGVSDAAAKLAGLYTKDVSNALVVNSAHVKQVRLKVRIVEVDRSKLDQFAFNFFSTGGTNLASTSTNQFPSSIAASNAGSSSNTTTGTTASAGSKTVSVSNALNFLLYSSKLNVGATIQDMETRQVLQILAEPTITALSGEKANFLAGGEFPFPVVQGGAGGLTSISIQFRPYGVKLEFTPFVNPDGSIELKVAPEVSALDYTNSVTISGYTIPALSTRRAETEVVLKSGQSFAISGLLDKRTTDSFSKTPGIANVPILGQLFKSKALNHSTTELIVVVTPTIVDPLSDTAFTETAVPEPALVIPLLDSKSFDKVLPKPSTNP
jgi:pilus assembly protein CpaC